MKRLLAAAIPMLGLAVSPFAATPRIGVSVSLKNPQWMNYASDSFFKERPIAVDMAKS